MLRAGAKRQEVEEKSRMKKKEATKRVWRHQMIPGRLPWGMEGRRETELAMLVVVHRMAEARHAGRRPPVARRKDMRGRALLGTRR